MTREDALVCAVLELIDHRNAWQAGSEENKLPEAFLTHVDATINLFETGGGIPQDCLGLFKLVERLKKEWEEFQMYISGRNPVPRQEFWRIITEMENTLTFAQPSVNEQRIEGVQELAGQGVSHRQIALIYSHEGVGPFMTNDKTPLPRVDLVKDEIAKPGSIIKPDFVHPRIIAERELASRYTNRIARRAAEIREQLEQGKVEQTAAVPVGPESIDELLAQGVPDNQIVKIKQCTLMEVLETKKRIADEQKSGAVPVDNQDPAVESSIFEFIASFPDAKNADIAKALNVTVRDVSSARRRMKEAAATAA